MKKIWIVIIIIVGALILTGIVALLVLRFITRHYFQPMDGPGMIYEVVIDGIEYVRNDNVSGGSYRISAKRDGKIRLEMEEKENADAEPVIREAEADEELFDRIEELILEAGLERAGNYTELDPYVMPDITSRLKVVEPYHTFTITSLMELSESELQAWNEIVAILEEPFAG